LTTFLFFLATACCLTLAASAVLLRRLEGQRVMRRRVGLLLAGLKQPDNAKAPGTSTSQPIAPLAPLYASIRQAVTRRMSPQAVRALERKLQEAGRPFQLRAADVRLLQLGFAVGFAAAVGLLCLSLGSSPTSAVLFAGAAGAYGAAYPIFYLKAKKKRRAVDIDKSMPDFFDLVNVSVEAGLGLDAAILKVCRQMKGPLPDEMARTMEEMQLGKSRREAFGAVRDRVPSEMLRMLMNALIQADQMGIGMSKVLRAQTKSMREHQRQRAKETAMKAPVKMLFPMILFIFPVLFIILMGPLVIHFVTEWM